MCSCGDFHSAISSLKVDFFFEGGFGLGFSGLLWFGGFGSGGLRLYFLIGLDGCC